MTLLRSITRELKAADDRREAVIKAGRDILREAKKIIFLCHEQKLDEADMRLHSLLKHVQEAEKKFKKPLFAGAGLYPLYSDGSWNACVEEFLEAWFLFQFLQKKKIIEPKGIAPKADVYVGALADCTGELVRLAVSHGAQKDHKSLEQYRKLTAQVVEFMLPLYLTGQSRQKFDQAKRNLKRIEEIIYEVKIRT